MASTEQHYSLRWNDYTVKIVTAFQSLRDEEDFVDVTVACDGHHYPAHKMVLSACSPYFRSLLRANPCQHPIVILKDVGHIEMERLLEFMYNGEVNIAQDQLAAFLKTAESLRIRGLAGSSDELELPQQSQKDLHQSYTTCLSGSGLSGIDDMSGPSSPSNFSGIAGCKDDLMVTEGVFASSSNSPPLKRRKRLSDGTHNGNVGHPVDNLSESIIEVNTDRGDSSGNGIDLDVDTRIERQELKAEPSDHLVDVYADADLNTDPNSHHESMAHRPVIYPMSSMPGPSGTQNQTQQELLLGNSQNSGDVSALMAIANAVQATAMSDRPIKCPLCQSIIKQARNLRRHVFKRHLPAAQRGEITEADVKNVLERKLKAITVTPLTDDELRQVQQRTRRRGVTKPRKLKGVAALPSDVNASNINESEITIRKLPQKKREKQIFTLLPVMDAHPGQHHQHEDILQEALAARDKETGPQDEVMDLAAPQQLPPMSVVVSQGPQSDVHSVEEPVSLTISQTTAGIHTRVGGDGLQGVRLQADTPLALHRELVTMSSMAFDPQVSLGENLATYATSPTQAIPQSTSPSPSVAGYIPGSYWSTSTMPGIPTASFQPHQAVFPTHTEYFTAGVHMVRPTTIERMPQHRRKPYQ